MSKDLIIIEDGNILKLNNKTELVDILLCKNYYNLPQNEKQEILEKKAIANSINLKKNAQIDTTNEDTFILSILIDNNQLLLYERKDANIFLKGFNTENLNNKYICINDYAKKLLRNKQKKYGTTIQEKNFPKAYAEAETILNMLSEDDYSKIDSNFLNLLKNNKDKNYKFEIDYSKDIKDQDVLKETRVVLAYVYNNYLATEEEKAIIDKNFKRQLIESEKEKRKKYPTNIF